MAKKSWLQRQLPCGKMAKMAAMAEEKRSMWQSGHGIAAAIIVSGNQRRRI